MEKVKAAKPVTSRLGGEATSSANNNTASILARHDAACTAMALLTDAVADLAADTEDAQLVKVALYTNRMTYEWHRLGDILPTVLQLALAAARERGQP